ncbi:MAG: DUF418 domain-containing protein [Gemmatimonadales bacterium]|nr:MAG: DUF418 domain-containing protein [Gemmatimonadales bacterium]
MGFSTAPDVDHEAPGPVAPSERIAVLDILRGFALFGVLVVNLPDLAWETGVSATRSGLLHQSIQWVVDFAFGHRFLGLFSILFGVGFVIQKERAARRGKPFLPVYLRRMAVLLVFGLLHALIYPGDILVRYALVGLLLPLAYRGSVRTVTVAAAALVILSAVGPVVGDLTGHLVSEPVVRVLDDANRSEFCSQTRERIMAEGIGGRRELYERGRLSQVAPVNLCRLPAEARWWIRTGRLEGILAYFLIGMVLARVGFFAGVQERKRLLKGVLLGGAVLGFALLALEMLTPDVETAMWDLVKRSLLSVGRLATCLAYGSGVILAFMTPTGVRILSPLGSVGRMALTAYLGQSLIATTLFYGYGLGWGRTLSSAGVIAVGFGIYAVLIPFCVVWLRYFRFGPLEWIWRSITYGRVQPLRGGAGR